MLVTAFRTAAVLLVFCAAAHGQQIPTLGTDESIRLALGRTIDEISCEDTPLEQVIKELRKRLGINIRVQWRELKDLGVDKDAPVRLKLKGVPARRLLQLALRDVGADADCRFELRDGVVVVSTSYRMGSELSLRTYSVRDLTGGAAQAAGPQADVSNRRLSSLIETIVDCIHPDCWVQNGGECTLDVADGILLLRGPARVQRDVQGLLAALRSAPKRGQATVEVEARPTPADERVRKALLRVIPEIRLKDAPLGAVVQWLREWLEENLYVEWKELAELGVRPNHPIQLDLKALTAERVLRAIIADLGPDVRLAYEIEDGVLVISTVEQLTALLFTAVYDVSDLTKTRIGPQRLIQIFVDAIEPDTWVQNGGEGTIAFFDDRLVIRNNRSAHRRVEKLLADIRKLAAREKADKREP